MAALPTTGGCSWQDLLPELLALVLLRLPSHADRIRLCAVCRPWRSGARLQPPLPPPLPWIFFGYGSILSLPDGRSSRLRIPWPFNLLQYVCTGDMIFFVHYDGSCSLMNLSSGQTTPQHIDPSVLEDLLPRTIQKVLVSDHIVAVLFSLCTVSITPRGPQRAGSCSSKEWALPAGSIVDDIVIFKGKLYILSTTTTNNTIRYRELHVMDFGPNQVIVPGITFVKCIRGTTRDTSAASKRKLHHYLVVSRDQLLMVEREVEMMSRYGKPIPIWTRRLKAFEATDLCGGDGCWRKVDTLMGNALFVSDECSASLPVDRYCEAQEDCIYFTSGFFMDSWKWGTKPEGAFLNSGVYDMRNQRMVPLPIATKPMEKIVASRVYQGSQAWLFVTPNEVDLRMY